MLDHEGSHSFIFDREDLQRQCAHLPKGSEIVLDQQLVGQLAIVNMNQEL